MFDSTKLTALIVIAALCFGNLPGTMLAAYGADPAETPAAPASASPAAPASAKEPLVEVSVDSLEISENDTSVLGILWGQSPTPGSPGGGGIGASNNINQSAFGLNHINFIERTIPSLFNIGQLDRNFIAAQLDALIQNNRVRILANPTLLTKSGFEATFLAGGEIPYPQVGQAGVSGVDYKKYGVGLKILPTITPRQTIDAQISVQVSFPDETVARIIQGVDVPGLTNRETGTKVEVKDGETVVLSGIKQSRREKTVVRVPILGYIPLLGLLFRHKQETSNQISIVLFVTFRLIKS